MKDTRSLFFVFALLATWLPASLVQAQTAENSDLSSTPDTPTISLEEIISQAVEEHDRLKQARADADSLRETARETLGSWFPSLDLTTALIRERIAREGGDAVKLASQELTVTITQLLWDFGATNGAVESARLAHVQSEIALFRTRQELITEAVQAYANLLRSVDVLAFAKQSEENIRVQTGLEEVRITAGSGLSTDLLQAKTQLAGAQARRVDAEGALDLALNRYRAVFGDVPANLDKLPAIELDRSSLPRDVEGALDLAFERNPQIREASIGIAISKQDRRSTYSDFLPTVEMIGESTAADNDGGAVGTRTESSIRLELSWPFNLGFTAINTLRAGQSDITSASRALADLRRTLEEQVRNAWKQLETSQIRSQFLFDQAEIARAFLDVAIEERRLGQRSLIDVLSGETALINAQSDAVAAETEVTLAALDLLAATGALAYEQIMEKARPERQVEIKREQDLGPDLGGEEGAVFDPSLLEGTGASEGETLDPNAVFQPPPSGDGGVFDPNVAPDLSGDIEGDASGEPAPTQESPSEDMPSETLPLSGADSGSEAFVPEPMPEAVPEPVPEPAPVQEPAPEQEPRPAPEPASEAEPAEEAAPEATPEAAAVSEPPAPEPPAPDPPAPEPPAPEGDDGLPDLFQDSINGGTSFDVDEPPPVPESGQGGEELESPLLKWAQ